VVQVGKPGAYVFEPGTDEQYDITNDLFTMNSKDSWHRYQIMLQNGIAKEVARMVLPLNLMSTMIVAMNPRALMNFLSLRVSSEFAKFPTFPMWEINQVANDYENVFAEHFPLTEMAFEDNGRVAP